MTVAVQSVPWKGATGYEVRTLDAKQDIGKVSGGRTDTGEVTVELPAHLVCLLKLRRHGKG